MLTTAASTSFLPNGLLGSSQNQFLQNGLLSDSSPIESSEDASFNPNRLLGGFSCAAAESFTSNGLLDERSTPTGLRSEPSFMVKDIETTSAKVDSFAPTGLLESNTSTAIDSFEPTGLLSNRLYATLEPPLQSLDDELPPLHEVVRSNSKVGTSRIPSLSTVFAPSRLTVKATTYEGKSIFLKKKSKTKRAVGGSGSEGRMGNLLDEPMHRLMDQLQVAASDRLEKSNQSFSSSNCENTLWVDRYRPRKFTELMGNERVARETLTWVKQWDWCVFGKNKGKKRSREEDLSEMDEYHRPKEKILLLSGPPGLGKTTLAHVVAKHAGYEVMEINASDARSGQIVDDRIRPTLEAGVGVKSSKPLLLVIDEIDGATGAGDNAGSFVHKLVQLTQDRPRKKTRSGRRDPNAKRPILRPIICICNDVNASSLVKLRPHAFQVRYQRPADVHTVKRLREICALEGLRADSRALSTLAGMAQGDLRGCLNTLQFIKSKYDEVTESVIREATRGMKESESSITTVMNSLFSPLSKKRAKEMGLNDEAESRYVDRLSREIDTCGRENSIAIGCFAHYITLRRHDANFSRHEKANEWLLTYDRMSAAMYSDGDFALTPYTPYTLVGFHPLFQERGAPRVERDVTDWENLQTTKTNDEIYKSLARCLQTASTRHGGDFRSLMNKPILQMEFAPMINRIISPPLRPVNSQIVKQEERLVLSRLVDVMSALEFRFVQERTDDGQLTYRLDPPVDVFTVYDGKRAADMAVPRYAVRHLVAEQLETRINTQQEITEKGTSTKSKFFGKKDIPGDDLNSNNLDDTRVTKRARMEVTDIADRPPTDFFGRLINPCAAPKSKGKQSVVLKDAGGKFRVSYKYKEGNSAAVRKPVKVSTFL
ncbi:P-loop containing nucleoside triphosphate hydrolase protein [Marasmius fiardii PR-910]|nr:P-loop containing nucleoside triphosphate hydrolase protein [Marasmius fiardii PR-910]